MKTKHGEVDLLAVRVDGLPFLFCLDTALQCPELIKQFDRLKGTNLGLRGAAIEVMVDMSSGRFDSDFQEFVWFVWECVFLRIPVIVDKPAKKL